MPTAVQELMSSPPITCDVDASLTEATSLMNSRQIGSVVVTDHRAIVGILTERDLLRASATSADPLTEPVRRWMTADPDVLGPRRRGGARPGRGSPITTTATSRWSTTAGWSGWCPSGIS